MIPLIVLIEHGQNHGGKRNGNQSPLKHRIFCI